MRKVRTALLVAAATLAGVPAIVLAQSPQQHDEHHEGRPEGAGRGDHGGDHGGGDHGGGDRGGRGQVPQAAAPQAQARQVQPPQQVQPQPQPQVRGDRTSGSGDFQRSQEYRGQRDGAGRDGRHDGQQDRRGPDGRNFAGEGQRQDQFRPNARGGGPDVERGRGFGGGYPDRSPGYGGPGYGGPDRGRGYDGRDRGPGAGVQGWRNDRRYDWHGYRDQHREVFRARRYSPPRGYGFGYRAFSPGYRLDPFFYDRSYWIDDPYAYRLPPAYGPYRWVQYYNDVLLVDLRTGTVVDVIRDFFW